MAEKLANSLPSAILATFTSISNDAAAECLAGFSVRDWKRLGNWFHASGLALYFLDSIRNRGIERALPAGVMEELHQNQSDNRERMASLFQEFAQLNAEFGHEGLDFINIKGFSLGPEYCATPGLRSQFDLDFWVRKDHAERCKAVMQRLGYQIVESRDTLECHTGGDAYPKLRDFYKPSRRRSVEIHLLSAEEFAQIPKANGLLNGFVFPVLPREQMFVQQAGHLAKHLRSEWTRASWMLELRNAIADGRHDSKFWRDMEEQCASQAARTAIGIAVAATAKVFRASIPPELGGWAVASLPAGVLRWVDEYSERVVTAQFPGTKLYMLLSRELAADGREFEKQRRVVLLPVRMPGYIATQKGSETNLRTHALHAKYAAMRLRFHVREGLRLLRAERAWRKPAHRTSTSVATRGSSIA